MDERDVIKLKVKTGLQKKGFSIVEILINDKLINESINETVIYLHSFIKEKK